MKSDIHPDYKDVIFLDISCDYKVLTRSTLSSSETMEWEDGNTYPVVRLDLSSASHPFYTGKDTIISKTGRIERFNQKYRKEESKAEAETETEKEKEESSAE